MMDNAYYLKSDGSPVQLNIIDPKQARLTWGEAPASVDGPPLNIVLQGTNIEFYPTPDFTGPSAGNYQVFFEGTSPVLHLAETSGNTAASATLTVPSTGYLTDEGILSTGAAMSVRGAGNLAQQSVPDTFVTSWSAFPSGTTITMGGTPPQTALTNVQVFMNSQNWIITNFPKVFAFGMAREIATYLKENYEQWEQRYQMELSLMEQYDADRRRMGEQLVQAVAGQLRSQYKDIDVPQIFDVRP